MEVGIKDTLLTHMYSSGLLNNSQHGFLKNKSTTTHLLECCLDWNVALRSKKAVDIIYLDFAKAFDSVVHSKLIAKLTYYGVNDMLLKWIESFLVGRSQFVRIGSSISNSCAVLSGVPQGSVLGPVLFIIYVNDIPRSRGVSIKLFADDTKLYTVLQDDSIASAELQNCLDAICEWSNEWQLKLAPAKCIVMRIRSGHSLKCSPSYHIGANSLPVVTSCTDLGVSYDDRLSFSPHLSKIVVKASQRAKLILKCFRSRDSQLLMRAFCTFVRPLLEFSSVIWSPYTIADLNRIESVQRSFTKAIQNLRFSTYKERLINLCVDSLQCRRIKADLVFCYKILHNLVDVNSNELFTLSQNTHLRGNKFKLVKPKSVSVRDSNFFVNRVVNIWNSLPDSIVTAESVYSFKRRLNSFDFSNFIIL
jgi:ribonuclease P/MRP protein subunit RPP40